MELQFRSASLPCADDFGLNCGHGDLLHPSGQARPYPDLTTQQTAAADVQARHRHRLLWLGLCVARYDFWPLDAGDLRVLVTGLDNLPDDYLVSQ